MQQAFTNQRESLAKRPSSVILWVTDSVGRVSFANDAYERYFGVTLAERGKGSSGLIHPEDAEAHGRAFARALQLRRPFHAVARVRRADGQWRWMESYGAPRFSSHHRFVGMIGSSTEVLESVPSSAEPPDELATALKAQTTRLRELIAQLDGGERDEAKQLAVLVHDELQRMRVAHRSLSKPLSGTGQPSWPTRELDELCEPLTPLTARESEIVELLLFHGRVQLVAEALHLSQHTVKNHLRSVFRKFGVHSQVELMRRLRQHHG